MSEDPHLVERLGAAWAQWDETPKEQGAVNRRERIVAEAAAEWGTNTLFLSREIQERRFQGDAPLIAARRARARFCAERDLKELVERVESVFACEVIYGEFTLRTGAPSHWYINKVPTDVHEAVANNQESP